MISIHAPRTGSDGDTADRADQPAQFQSTLPARGATRRMDFYIICTIKFQSTLPARGATTAQHPDTPTRGHFNPRSPHGERRDTYFLGCLYAWDFNPRSPHGERHCESCNQPCLTTFQSTLPARGATAASPEKTFAGTISIHAPRTGSDRKVSNQDGLSPGFQSTLPARGAT